MLPPKITAETFQKVLASFRSIVGPEWVFTTDDDLALYRDAYSPLRNQPDERVASAAIAPANVDEVQAIVRVANQWNIPLYPISTGKDLGYGGSAPATSGSVVLDLKRMNRIIEVDDKNYFALVEPGVSYFDLYRYIQEKGLKVWVDVPDPGWGSLIGNALDRGAGYLMPQFRNHFDSHCGMEVVLADGSLVRTGMGAMPNAKTWQQFKAGCGPWVDGIFSQSNFGIVTKMGFWLMPAPEAYLHCEVRAPLYNDLHALVSETNYLEDLHVINGMTSLGSPLLNIFTPGAGTTRDIIFDGAPTISAEQKKLIETADVGYSKSLEDYGLRHQIPYWSLGITYYGPPEVVKAHWEATKRRYSKVIEGASFEEEDVILLPLSKQEAENTKRPDEFGIPSLRVFSIGARSRFSPTPSSGHFFFSPIIPRTGEGIIAANRVFTEAAKKYNLPFSSVFNLPFAPFERSFLFTFGFGISDDPEINAKHLAVLRKFIDIAAENGWGEYRSPTIIQEQVMKSYSFNDNALMALHSKIKSALDPKGIISPGRYAISGNDIFKRSGN